MSIVSQGMAGAVVGAEAGGPGGAGGARDEEAPESGVLVGARGRMVPGAVPMLALLVLVLVPAPGLSPEGEARGGGMSAWLCHGAWTLREAMAAANRSVSSGRTGATLSHMDHQ